MTELHDLLDFPATDGKLDFTFDAKNFDNFGVELILIGGVKFDGWSLN